MSIQSDIEMLSIASAEKYACRNHMSIEEVYEVFHKHQIFEKIILQHEYLHQVSSEDVLDFIYSEIEKDQHDLVVFHGTDVDFSEIVLNKCKRQLTPSS